MLATQVELDLIAWCVPLRKCTISDGPWATLRVQFGKNNMLYKDMITLSSSVNCTHGSRSYSDVVDTQTISVCIHQLILKPWHLKPACIM